MQRKPFGFQVVSLAISSKILLCDNSETMAWSKELKYHQKRKCYLIVRQYRQVMRHATKKFLRCLVYFWGQCEFAGIEPLKARCDVTKLDLTTPLLSFWCMDIEISIQSLFLTLYMIWVHQELHKIYKSWVSCNQISFPQLIHGFKQFSRDCSAPPSNWRNDLSWLLGWVSHGE